MENLVNGLRLLGNGPAIAYLFTGSLLGMIVGVIPGLSTVVILSILLIFVYHINLIATLCLFLGAQCASFYSASVSAILLNTPGHPEAFPITLDGYPMARKGQPGRALGLSAGSTLVGGLIGCGVLIAFLQVIDQLPDLFHPPEYVALVILAILLVGTVGTKSVAKAVASGGLGVVLASVGSSTITGAYRYTFGSQSLYAGIALVALALGVFAIPQMLMIFGTGTATARQSITGEEIDPQEMVEVSHGYGRELTRGFLETFRHWPMLLQSGLVGGITGAIPGIGGFTGNFMAYGIARQTSPRRKRELFGTGIPDGIIAPEGSSLAKEAGHIIPIIGLGIPGGVAGALFIAALTIQGLKLGYGFQSANPNVTGSIVWIIALSGAIGTFSGVLIGPQIAKVTRLPGPLIVPFILALSVSGAFIAQVQFFSVLELFVFGVVGLLLRRLSYPVGPLVIGLVLGPTLETNIFLTNNVYPNFSWVTERPFADVIFLLSLAVLVSKWLELRRESKQATTSYAQELQAAGSEAERLGVVRRRDRRLAPYPLLSVIVDICLLAAGLFVILVAISDHYNFQTGAMPIIGACLLALPLAIVLPRDLHRYWLHREAKAATATPALDAEPETPVGDRALPLTMPGGVLEGPVELATGGTVAVGTAAPELEGAKRTGLASTVVMPERSWGRHGQYRRELIAVGWIAALVGLCWLIGFTWGTAIFMLAYGMVSTRLYLKRIVTRLLFSCLSAIVMGGLVAATFDMLGLTFTSVIHP